MRLTRTLSREMYAEDRRTPSVAHYRDDTDEGYPPDSVPAIEVIEFANGETVWCAPYHVSGNTLDTHAQNVFRSIVNGLRGDDNGSFYGNRANTTAKYSVPDWQSNGAVNWPETKVRRLPIVLAARVDLTDGDLGDSIGVLQQFGTSWTSDRKSVQGYGFGVL